MSYILLVLLGEAAGMGEAGGMGEAPEMDEGGTTAMSGADNNSNKREPKFILKSRKKYRVS